MRVWIETSSTQHTEQVNQVTLYVRVWIETFTCIVSYVVIPVTLYVRVWIETTCFATLPFAD